MLGSWRKRRRRVRRALLAAESGLQLLRQQLLEQILQEHRRHRPASLIPYGAKIYSQNDEDGMIAEIFRRIGEGNRSFIEIGVGNGLENNTLALLMRGWSGLWLEGDGKAVAAIRAGLPNPIAAGVLKVGQAFVTAENVAELVGSLGPRSPELLSIDVDGNDYHLLAALEGIRPRLIVMEYNARFTPPVEYCMPYDPRHVWDGSDRFGASLSFLERRLRDRGYLLVGCNITGINAFFVREDCAGDHFETPFTAEQHFQPARYELTGWNAGHPASYRTVNELFIPAGSPSAAPATGGQG